ncbi:prophage protein [Lactobacillus amylovorus]|uniref:Prophage protein n=1 Tax=Lactobacillus amylovorus TaxID=1604 RepID=F0TFE1_LACAM|nr:phage portal protein [Lactobacillus amylovorus]ADZ07435.1 prophage protein [Lactobacillus amylovorus]
MKTIDFGNDKVTNNTRFIYPAGQRLSGNELLGFISYNENTLRDRYRRNMHYYLGKHDILDEPNNKSDNINNKLVDNKIKPLEDSYNGFFAGIPPVISAEDETINDAIQDWNDENSFQDELNEISKQADIFGRSIVFIYQGEDKKPHLMHSSPEHAFIIYDDTVAHNPLAFVRYEVDDLKNWTSATGQLQYADKIYTFVGQEIIEDTETNDAAINPYGIVPAVEFYENEERQSVFEQVITLQDELDHVMSQKANQISYFDNAYMYMFGVALDEDKDGKPIFNFKENRLIYAPNIDPNSDPKVGFIQKPDADNMQENMIDHLQKSIYENTEIANLRDENFANNASGVAMQYKLLSMQNKADSKERKFTKALKQMYRIVFQTLFNNANQREQWSTLKFHFTRNLPDDIASMISAAKNAEGMVSQQTQLSLLPFVKDPQAEIEQINKEKQENIKNAQKAADSLPDYMKQDQESDSDAQEQ